MNCSVCKKPVTENQSSVDHIKPGRFGGLNTTTVHLQCNRQKLPLWKRIMRWIGRKRWEAQLRRDAREMEATCYKTSMGYRCRHEMHGNVRECGEKR